MIRLNHIEKTFGLDERSFSVYFDGRTNKGERIFATFYQTKVNPEDKRGLPYLWKKKGYTDEILPSYWSVNVYTRRDIKPGEQLCYGRHLAYNPTIGEDNKLNFDWVLEGTNENMKELIAEIERRANGEGRLPE